MSSDAQVQNIADTQYRPRCEAIRAILFGMMGDRTSINDVMSYLNNNGNKWIDARADTPPHTLTASDMIVINSLEMNLIAILNNTLTLDSDKINAVNAIQGAISIALSACVRPVQVG